mmetsp:Transcript_9574/g.14262  ORF Transcript_9574/g.14262 Transcript_9574/m.14262 type:complete len:336 (+) Transcript_9574:5-1012(+)
MFRTKYFDVESEVDSNRSFGVEETPLSLGVTSPQVSRFNQYAEEVIKNSQDYSYFTMRSASAHSRKSKVSRNIPSNESYSKQLPKQRILKLESRTPKGSCVSSSSSASPERSAVSQVPKIAAFDERGEKLSFTEEEIKSAFDTFDMDGNGFIGSEEIRIVMDSIGEYVTDEEIDEMIRMLDSSSSGRVAFKEFYKMAKGESLGQVGGALPPPPSNESLKNKSFKSYESNQTKLSESKLPSESIKKNYNISETSKKPLDQASDRRAQPKRFKPFSVEPGKHSEPRAESEVPNSDSVNSFGGVKVRNLREQLNLRVKDSKHKSPKESWKALQVASQD